MNRLVDHGPSTRSSGFPERSVLDEAKSSRGVLTTEIASVGLVFLLSWIPPGSTFPFHHPWHGTAGAVLLNHGCFPRFSKGRHRPTGECFPMGLILAGSIGPRLYSGVRVAVGLDSEPHAAELNHCLAAPTPVERSCRSCDKGLSGPCGARFGTAKRAVAVSGEVAWVLSFWLRGKRIPAGDGSPRDSCCWTPLD